jgi:NitT/TauT family transport system substrate-binding protein
MSGNRPRRVWLVATILVLVAMSCGDDASPGETEASGSTDLETTEIKWNIGFAGISYADLYVADAEGFFEDAGLSVEIVASATDPSTVVLTNEAHFSSGQPAATYLPNAEGGDIVGFYSPTGTYEAFASKELTSVDQLSGKTVGVFGLTDLDVIYTKWMLEQNGLSVDDVELVAAGPTNEKLAAVSAGGVDAAPLYAPANLVAQGQGLNILFETTELDIGQVPTFYIARRSWLEENPNTVVAVIRALNRAHEWLFDPSNRDRGIDIVAEATDAEEELTTEAYDFYFKDPDLIYTETGEWDREVVEMMAEELVDVGLLEEDPVPYEDTVAPEYRERALSSD